MVTSSKLWSSEYLNLQVTEAGDWTTSIVQPSRWSRRKRAKAAFWGATSIGGLTTATPLTLLVVPVFYTFFDDVQLVAGRASASVCVS